MDGSSPLSAWDYDGGKARLVVYVGGKMIGRMEHTLQKMFLRQVYSAARAAEHPWPGPAAAEAWVETGGTHWPRGSCNILGIKAYHGWNGPVCTANGTEQEIGGSFTAPAPMLWCVFPTLVDCFREQVKILQEPRYALAMAATTAEDYIREECKVWSTGILKGEEVLQTYHAHLDILAPETK